MNQKIFFDELWNGYLSNINHIRKFECVIYAHISKEMKAKLNRIFFAEIFVKYHSTFQMRVYNPAIKKIHWHTTMKFLEDQSGGKLLEKNAIEKEIFWNLDDVDDDDDNENDENEKNQEDQNAFVPQQFPEEFPEQPAPKSGKIRELIKDDSSINHENYTPPTNQMAEKSKKRKKDKKSSLNLTNQHVGTRALDSLTIDINLIKI